MSKTYTIQAIVLKRRNFADTDRFITLFSLEQGKLTVLAKGVRRLTSKKRSALEPGSQIKALLITGRSIDLLGEATLVKSQPFLEHGLIQLTKLHQILEIIDSLTAELEAHPAIYRELVSLLAALSNSSASKSQIIQSVRSIVADLGFGLPADDSEIALKHHLQSISGRRLNSKTFLTPS